jgi:aminoglycoside phosphotransferase
MATDVDLPTEADAAEIVRRVSGKGIESIRRFPTGLAHWVYDVRMLDGSGVVVRLGKPDQRGDFQGALHWSKTLRPLAVPLPQILAHGDHRDRPYLVLERLDGQDLGQVYRSLTSPERRSIAEEVCQVQRIVGGLPERLGYGFIRLPGEPGRVSWSDVIEASLARCRRRIEKARLLSPDSVDRVARHARRFFSYFSRVRPTPFLDDVTTKNVLVHAGRFNGIVDVDGLCFGDSLFAVALTRAALLATGDDPEYSDHWCDVLALGAEQHDAVRFYTALFCVEFMSEFGQRFSQGVQQFDSERLARLEKLLNENLNDTK